MPAAVRSGAMTLGDETLQIRYGSLAGNVPKSHQSNHGEELTGKKAKVVVSTNPCVLFLHTSEPVILYMVAAPTIRVPALYVHCFLSCRLQFGTNESTLS